MSTLTTYQVFDLRPQATIGISGKTVTAPTSMDAVAASFRNYRLGGIESCAPAGAQFMVMTPETIAYFFRLG